MSATNSGYTLTASSVLMEDYIVTNNILVNTSLPNQVGSFYGAAGDLQCLVITGGDANELAWVYPNPGSAGGWNIYYFPGVTGVTQVAAVVQQGVVLAIYQDAAGSHGLTFSFSAGQWSTNIAMPAFLDTIRICCSSDNNQATFYGLTAAGPQQVYMPLQLVIYDDTQNTFLVYTEENVSGNISAFTAGANYLLMYNSIQDRAAYQLCLNFPVANTVMGTSLTLYDVAILEAGFFEAIGEFSFTIPLMQLAEFILQDQNSPLPVSQIIGTYSGNIDPATQNLNTELLFLSTDQHLYVLINGGDGPVDTGLVFESAAVVEGDLVTIFGVNNDGILSSLRQTGLDNNSLPLWAPAIPIATDIATVYCPSLIQGQVTDIAAVDINGHLTWCNFSTAGWTFSPVQLPPDQSTGPVQVSQFQTELNVFDENNCPAAGVSIVINADSLISIVSRGNSYVTGPGTDQQLTLLSDSMGKLSFSTLAYGITANGITVTVPGGTPFSIAPDQQVTAYFTTGIAMNNLLPFSSATLVAATDSSGNPLVPGIQGASGSGLAGPVTAALQNTFALRNVSNGTIVNPQTGETITGYSLDMTDPSNAVYSFYTKPGEAAAVRSMIKNRLQLVRGKLPENSIIGDLENLAHDIWHGIKSGAAAVSHWVVDVENDIVTIVSADINAAVELALSDLESIGSVAHSIFNAVGADVDKVVEWLRFMFDWQDILNTSDVIQQNILGAFDSIENVLQSAKTKLDGFFANQETAVTNLLNNYITAMNGKSLTDLGNQPTQATSLAALKATGSSTQLTAPLFNNDPKHNWLFNKTLTAFNSGFTTTTYESALSTPFTSLLNQFSTSWTTFKTSATSFFQAELTAANGNASSYLTRGVTDILTGLKALVPGLLGLINDIIDLLIDLVTAIISIADDALNTPLDQLPLIGPILQAIEKVSGVSFGNLTMTSLVSLLIAIPVTLTYKLINGASSQPFPPAQSLKVKDTGDASTTAEAMGFVNTGMTAFNTLCTTVADLFPPETPVPKPLQFFLIVPQVGVQAFCFPPGYTSPLTLKTTADWVNTCGWLWGWMPITRQLTTACIPDATVAPFADPFIPGLDSVLSGVQLGWNITGMAMKVKNGESETAADIASVFVNPAPGIFSILKSQVLFSGEALELNVALKILLDFFFGGAAVVLDGVEAVEG